MTDYSEFSISKIAGEGLAGEADRLVKEEGLSEADALRSAASTLDGAGDNPDGTVESVQTCTDVEGNSVVGLTSDDSPTIRTDPYVSSQKIRHEMADKGKDEAADWLRQNDPRYPKV